MQDSSSDSEYEEELKTPVASKKKKIGESGRICWAPAPVRIRRNLCIYHSPEPGSDHSICALNFAGEDIGEPTDLAHCSAVTMSSESLLDSLCNEGFLEIIGYQADGGALVSTFVCEHRFSWNDVVIACQAVGLVLNKKTVQCPFCHKFLVPTHIE
jgi:hypothetical protein